MGDNMNMKQTENPTTAQRASTNPVTGGFTTARSAADNAADFPTEDYPALDPR